jgi:hypothetical protein
MKSNPTTSRETWRLLVSSYRGFACAVNRLMLASMVFMMAFLKVLFTLTRYITNRMIFLVTPGICQVKTRFSCRLEGRSRTSTGSSTLKKILSLTIHGMASVKDVSSTRASKKRQIRFTLTRLLKLGGCKNFSLPMTSRPQDIVSVVQ